MIQLVLEVFILAFMGFITFEMYRRVEIRHPIFFMLFVNLIVTEISVVIDFALMILSPTNFDEAFAINNYLCLQFHTVSWLILSIQR